MDLTFDQEQLALKDSAERFVERRYDFARRQRYLTQASRFDREVWSLFAANGWLGVLVPEEYEGIGASAVETMILMEAFGGGLILEPYLASAVLATVALTRAGSEAQKGRWLPPMARGETVMALAHGESGSRGDFARVSLRAAPVASGFRLDGVKSMVLGGPHANAYIVSAAVGEPGGAERLELFVVEAGSAGLAREDYTLVDGSNACDVVLDGVTVGESNRLACPGGALPAVEAALAHGIAALCAEAAGLLDRAISITAKYLLTREQFQAKLASFQALRHRLADAAIDLEFARVMALRAARAAVQEGPGRTAELAAAKSMVGRSVKRACGDCLQMHGGIGMTEEYAVGHYYKRAVAIDAAFGNSDHHLGVFTRLLQERVLAEFG